MISRRNKALTMIELLVVISIITLLGSLLLPAVQAAREAARKVTCRNNVRQCTLALVNFETSFRQFPSDGWGWAWVGDSSMNNNLDGPGGWIFNVLPQLERNDLWDLSGNEQGRTIAIGAPIEILLCPSRRSSQEFPYTQEIVPLRNCLRPQRGSRTDYAINAGDRILVTPPGPETVQDLRNHPRPSPNSYSGISYVRSAIKIRDIRDGMSHTLAVAEKLVPVAAYSTGQSLGDDQTAMLGDDADIRRWTEFLPLRDDDVDDVERFGSPHPSGVVGSMCDGSVQDVAFSIDGIIWKQLGNRHDNR